MTRRWLNSLVSLIVHSQPPARRGKADDDFAEPAAGRHRVLAGRHTREVGVGVEHFHGRVRAGRGRGEDQQ